MADMTDVRTWIEGYVRAWNSNDPADIGGLFTDDAEYYTAPFRPPWRGRTAIVDGWLGRKDEPGDAAFEWRPVARDGEVAVIEGTTRYREQTYSNLWVIHLTGDGRCRRFTEWWMDQSRDAEEG